MFAGSPDGLLTQHSLLTQLNSAALDALVLVLCVLLLLALPLAE